MTIAVERCIVSRDLTEPRLSPDGRCIVFAMASGGSAALLIDMLDGTPTRQLTAYPAPRPGRGFGGGCWCWTPDGSAVVYVAVDGDLWLQPVPTGSVRQLTKHGPERTAAGPAVVRDGSRVLYVIDEAELWVARLDSGTDADGDFGLSERLDGCGADFIFDPCATPDGNVVVCQAWNVPDMPWDTSRIQRFTFGGSGVTENHVPATIQQLQFMPDGTEVCLRDDGGWLNVWLGDAALVDEPFEHGGPAWGMGQRSFAISPDGTRIAFIRNERGFGRLCVVDVVTRMVEEVARGVHGQLSWQGTRLAALRSGARTPTQVVVYDDVTWDRTVIAIGPLSGWEDLPLAEPELVEVAASDTGTVHARLYRADSATDRLLCWLHGGPTDQWQVTFMPRIAYWRAEGWNVLVPDHRGSTGHGRAYQQALRGRWGELDVSDVAAVIVHAHSRGWGSPAHTAIVGSSAGGFTALGVVASHPQLLAAAIVAYPVTDLSDLAERSHRFERHYTDSLVGPLPEASGRYHQRSPLHFVDRLKATPLLVMHGDGDPVVPIEQSRAFVDGCLAAGCVVDFVVYEGEGHGFRRPENQLDEYRRMQAFLANKRSWRIASPVVTDDWNPNDPDATQVHYDLANWSFEQMAELAAALADAEIRHAWDGNELIVPESAEEATDDIVAQVELRLGMADTIADNGVAAPREPVPLADDAPSTEYDLAEWEQSERELITSHLVARGLPFRWEEDVLLVGTDDEELVDSILDEVENDEGIELPDDADDDDEADQLPFETLTTFFLAGDRLQRNPLDADGLEQLLSAIDVADPDRPPYGVDKRLWTRMCELADDLAAALVDGEEPDVIETQAVATELHDLLRPYV